MTHDKIKGNTLDPQKKRSSKSIAIGLIYHGESIIGDNAWVKLDVVHRIVLLEHDSDVG